MALIFAFSFVGNLSILPAMVAVTAALFVFSKLPVSFMLTRLRYPGFFILAVILILPFLSGHTVILSMGPLDLRQEGLVSVLSIATRFLSILTIGLVLFGTTPVLTTIKSMRALGLPSILADMAFLFFRYLFEISNDLRRMQMGMKLRGLSVRRFSFHGLRMLAWLGGSILVRSYERADRVYKAMILRGYGHEGGSQYDLRASSRDLIALGVILMIAGGFVAGEILV
jgi:cobalt/nickel transport system permease protein